MQQLYLVPIETNAEGWRGPKYFEWFGDPDPPGIECQWAMMDYGFAPTALLLAKDITQADHDGLILNSDVFNFPDDLNGPVDDPAVDAFFEGINLPTDWLTPATTWLELLRMCAGIFVFNQRYNGLSNGHSIFENATLETRLRQMTDQEQVWFLATVESFGYDPALVDTNAKLRLLVRQAGDYWAGQPFYLGGWEF